MQLFLSTTFFGQERTYLPDVLNLIDGLDLDGVELGSTHKFMSNPGELVRGRCSYPLVTHNFFPPSRELDFVVNIASLNDTNWESSVNYAISCIRFAAQIQAQTYTIHPGFLADPHARVADGENYDFRFESRKATLAEAFDRMSAALEILIEIAIENGVNLAIETEGSLTNNDVLLMTSLDEYKRLFEKFPNHLYLNLNLAHTRFAMWTHKYTLDKLLTEYSYKIILVELSDNDGFSDQHKPLSPDSFVFNYLHKLPDVPLILEFRNATLSSVRSSISLVRQFGI